MELVGLIALRELGIDINDLDRREARFMDIAAGHTFACVDNVVNDNYGSNIIRDHKEPVPNTLKQFIDAIYSEVIYEGKLEPWFAKDIRFIGKDKMMAEIKKLAIWRVKAMQNEGFKFPNISEEELEGAR